MDHNYFGMDYAGAIELGDKVRVSDPCYNMSTQYAVRLKTFFQEYIDAI